MERARHQIVPYPASRIGTIDLGRVGGRKHHVAGLLEVDVTDAIAAVRKMRATGTRVTFFSWMVKAIADSIAENRYVHAVRGRGNTTVAFDDVDISIAVERTIDGVNVPVPLLIRKTDQKSLLQISAEIHDAQHAPITDEGDYVLADSRPSQLSMRIYYASPGWLRQLAMRWILRNPHRTKAMMGTAIITSVGGAGHLSGWILPKSMHNLCFALGSVTKKPRVVEGKILARDILHLTMLFDHDVVDGVPAMRFASRLVARIQSPAGAAGSE